MLTTQSIIVYRNPLEQAIWEGLMTSNSIFPIICGIVVFFIAVIASQTLIVDRFAWNKRAVASNVSLAISAAIGVFTVWYMI